MRANPYYTMRAEDDPLLANINNAVILFNPAAASGRRRRRRIADIEAAQQILREAGITATVQPTQAPQSATQQARDAIRAGAELIIACGGDGTINEVVNGMAGSPVPLAILPSGTANVVAKELGLPWNILAAAKLIPSCNRRRIALGLAISPVKNSQRYFLSLAGAGPDGSMVHAIDDAFKQRAGILAYWLEGLRHLITYSLTQFPVSIANSACATSEQFPPGTAGARAERTTAVTLVMVGRTKHYGGPFRITTNASLFEDCFEVALYRTQSRLRFLFYLPAVWLSLLRRMKEIEFLKTTELRCEPNPNQTIYVQLDGEAAGTLPTEFRIVPDALTLAVPPDAEPAR